MPQSDHVPTHMVPTVWASCVVFTERHFVHDLVWPCRQPWHCCSASEVGGGLRKPKDGMDEELYGVVELANLVRPGEKPRQTSNHRALETFVEKNG